MRKQGFFRTFLLNLTKFNCNVKLISLSPSGKAKKYVILSASEISHNQSEKVHIPVSSSVGFFTSFRMT